jgi:hypothetical protein
MLALVRTVAGLAALGAIGYGLHQVAPWLAYVVVGALVFALVVSGALFEVLVAVHEFRRGKL